MPSFPFVSMSPARVRKDPLGPITLNQLHANTEALDGLHRGEHLADGRHNALEVPWVLGHLADGSPPTGYLLDTAYGGGALTRPATGRYAVDVASGVIVAGLDNSLILSGMANVSGNAIEATPHTVTMEAVSSTSVAFRVRALSALGAGNTWSDANRDIDIGIHASARTASASSLLARLSKARRHFLTEQTTDWNALVVNQSATRKAALAEHTSAGEHNTNRVARAVGWFNYAPTAYSIAASRGVASVSRLSTGVVEVTTNRTFSAATAMACFPEVQPGTTSELVIINGRSFTTTTFRFYIYAYSGGSWARADRTFFAAMFGV